ncbi:2OG-Fe(II) oxygenase [Novosphingobium sp. PY1]|jgi:PKHD-type hydroxylase|uniref:2OG-Fe(II) oxygenase n=1 Tax=Novosphingobium sp. PY1 TaxID=1882221 RepID=UPI001A904C35|nr:2OG-Fe(II) oxygenase [Novosphingobium sp. PY1]GFM31490.1 2OG-Fe(II) oxygenase [Novosphingobium sp. PY1]
MKNVWEVWPTALTKAECDAITKRALSYPQQDATVGFADQRRANSGHRTSQIRWLDANREKDIVSRIMTFVSSSNRTNFGADIVAPFDLQFTQYNATNAGHYDWHQDVWLESPRPFDRKLSVVVQLSEPDEYNGGEFEFFGLQNPGATFANRGSMLIFPSFLQHRVLPVVNGKRQSLVTWVEGPKWR